MNQPTARYWANVAADWHATHRDRLWRAHSDAVNIALFRRWLPPAPVPRLLKTDVFDEAVATGLDDLLLAAARHVVGMDISHATLRQARSARRHAVTADTRDLPFATGSFDIIISNSTLDHFPSLPDLRASLRELHRILKPGGELLLTLDNLANPKIALRRLLPYRLLHRLDLLPYYVGYTCGPRRLRALLETTGFQLRELTAVMHAPRVLAVRLARWLTGRSPAAQTKFLRALAACERLEPLPTRFLTGHFLAVRARKP